MMLYNTLNDDIRKSWQRTCAKLFFVVVPRTYLFCLNGWRGDMFLWQEFSNFLKGDNKLVFDLSSWWYEYGEFWRRREGVQSLIDDHVPSFVTKILRQFSLAMERHLCSSCHRRHQYYFIIKNPHKCFKRKNTLRKNTTEMLLVI